jgi:hypothetical protein
MEQISATKYDVQSQRYCFAVTPNDQIQQCHSWLYLRSRADAMSTLLSPLRRGSAVSEAELQGLRPFCTIVHNSLLHSDLLALKTQWTNKLQRITGFDTIRLLMADVDIWIEPR